MESPDLTAILQTLTELRDRSRRQRMLYQELHERSCRRLEQLAMVQRLNDIERRLTRLEVTSASR